MAEHPPGQTPEDFFKGRIPPPLSTKSAKLRPPEQKNCAEIPPLGNYLIQQRNTKHETEIVKLQY